MSHGLSKIWRSAGYSVLAVASVGGVATVVIPVFSKPKVDHRPRGMRSCMTNLRRLTEAAIMYDEEQGHLPPANRWMESLSPYVHGTEKFRCPSLPSDNPYSYGYAMRSRLGGVGLHTVPHPEREPMLFDSWPLGRNAHTDMVIIPGFSRHSGQHIGYADGHTVFSPSMKLAN